jgi:hypothetical protein
MESVLLDVAGHRRSPATIFDRPCWVRSLGDNQRMRRRFSTGRLMGRGDMVCWLAVVRKPVVGPG